MTRCFIWCFALSLDLEHSQLRIGLELQISHSNVADNDCCTSCHSGRQYCIPRIDQQVHTDTMGRHQLPQHAWWPLHSCYRIVSQQRTSRRISPQVAHNSMKSAKQRKQCQKQSNHLKLLPSFTNQPGMICTVFRCGRDVRVVTAKPDVMITLSDLTVSLTTISPGLSFPAEKAVKGTLTKAESPSTRIPFFKSAWWSHPPNKLTYTTLYNKLAITFCQCTT